VATGRLAGRFAVTGLINQLAFSPDGTRLASDDAEGMLRVWRLR
jgi:hypothetical protein